MLPRVCGKLHAAGRAAHPRRSTEFAPGRGARQGRAGGRRSRTWWAGSVFPNGRVSTTGGSPRHAAVVQPLPFPTTKVHRALALSVLWTSLSGGGRRVPLVSACTACSNPWVLAGVRAGGRCGTNAPPGSSSATGAPGRRPRHLPAAAASSPAQVALERGRLDAVIAGLLFMAGMRRSEVSALRWADAADGDGVLVTVRRGKTVNLRRGRTWLSRGADGATAPGRTGSRGARSRTRAGAADERSSSEGRGRSIREEPLGCRRSTAP